MLPFGDTVALAIFFVVAVATKLVTCVVATEFGAAVASASGMRLALARDPQSWLRMLRGQAAFVF